METSISGFGLGDMVSRYVNDFCLALAEKAGASTSTQSADHRVLCKMAALGTLRIYAVLVMGREDPISV